MMAIEPIRRILSVGIVKIIYLSKNKKSKIILINNQHRFVKRTKKFPGKERGLNTVI